MKTVIITGAGAGKADGLPVQTELFGQFFRSSANLQARQTLRGQITEFFEKVFLINPSVAAARLPTFEEALGVIELAILREEDVIGMHSENGRTDEIRRRLILALAATIAEPSTSGSVHKTLVRNLRDGNALRNITFVTTNYDTLLDDAIEAEGVVGSRGSGSLIDYGLSSLSETQAGPHSETRKVACYKLHGSLNWLYCQACSILDVTYSTNGATRLIDDPESAGCPGCDTPRIPIIVPPSYFKDISNLYLSLVWNRAFQAMKNADRLIFCGYSFPDADMHVKFLVKRSQLNRDPNNPLRIDLVNYFAGKSTQMVEEELARYRRFLGGDCVHDSGMSFADFSSDPLRLLSARH